jgi:hypothetical protein
VLSQRNQSTYILELFRPRASSDTLEQMAERVCASADAAREAGADVRYLRTLFLPEDETCFFVFSAPSSESVRRACEHAGIASGRVVAAVQLNQTQEREDQ